MYVLDLYDPALEFICWSAVSIRRIIKTYLNACHFYCPSVASSRQTGKVWDVNRLAASLVTVVTSIDCLRHFAILVLSTYWLVRLFVLYFVLVDVLFVWRACVM